MSIGIVVGNADQAACTSPFLCACEPLPAAKLAQQQAHAKAHGLAIFAGFNDGSPTKKKPPEWSAQLFKAELPGSFTHFYHTMSRGKAQFTGEVAPWQYTARGAPQDYLAETAIEQGDYGRFSLEIIQAADQDIDFAQYDNDGPDGRPNSGDDDGLVDLLFIVADATPARFILGNATGVRRLGFVRGYTTNDQGYSGEPILVSPGNGTLQRGRFFAEAAASMCHEYGHILGLPDLFNVDFLQSGATDPAQDSAGIGAWGLMGWGTLGWNGDDGPTSLSAWSRMRLGWADVQEIKQAQQTVRLEDVAATGQLVKVPLGGQEYFLLENRRRDHFYDRHIPGEGVLIWHVYRTSPGEDEAPARFVIDLETADGRWQDAGYPAGRRADPLNGQDNLDFWAHDPDYSQRFHGNQGDASDPFDGAVYTQFNARTNPAAFDRHGRNAIGVENIRFDGGVAQMEVRTAPMQVEIAGLRLIDANGDGVLFAEEAVQITFHIRNTGGLNARNVEVRLHSADSLVAVQDTVVGLGDVELGERSFGVRQGRFPSFRFSKDFTGNHPTEVSLEVWIDGVYFSRQAVPVTGLSPRQRVLGISIIDTLGNGDGQVQPGEFIRPQIHLEGQHTELLPFLRFGLRALDSQVQQSSGGLLRFGQSGAGMTSTHGPEFLVPAAWDRARPLAFELWISTDFGGWRDTLHVDVLAGQDRTPPRVLALRTRPALDRSVRLVLPVSQVLDGSPLERAEAVIYSAEDTTELGRIELVRDASRFEGVWSSPTAGVFLVQAVVEDGAGNIGRSRLQGVSAVEPPVGQGLPDSPWQPVDWPVPQAKPQVQAVYLAPGNPDVLYMTSGNGAWRSSDGGTSWTELDIMRFTQLMIDAVDPFTLYTQFPPHLRSRDGGISWERLPTEDIQLVAVDPVQTGKVYGRLDGFMMVSRDWGQRWETTGVEGVLQVWVNERQPLRIYAGYPSRWNPETRQTENGRLYISQDGGQTWERRDLDRVFDYLQLDRDHPQGLYATRLRTLFYSADAGRSWAEVRKFSGRNPMQLAIHPHQAQWMAAWDFYGATVWLTRDGGQQWEAIEPGVRIFGFVFHPHDPQRWFVVGQDRSRPRPVLFTVDSGVHWDELTHPETTGAAGSLVFDPQGRLYVGTSSSSEQGALKPGVAVSADGGGRWDLRGDKALSFFSATPDPMDVLTLNPLNPELMLGHLNSTFVRSADGGVTWQRIGSIWNFAQFSYPDILVDPQRPQVYFLVGWSAVHRSVDFGQSWEVLGAGLWPRQNVRGLALDPAVSGVLYLASADSLWRSADDGVHWGFWGQVEAGVEFYEIAFHPQQPGTLYALTGGGLFASEDTGRSWKFLSAASVFAGGPYRMRFDPADPDRFFVVTSADVLETRNGGQIWRSLGTSLAHMPHINDVAVDPVDPAVLFASTPRGVYRLDAGAINTAVEDRAVPSRLRLAQNYPNPFNPSTTIAYQIQQGTDVRLTVYNILGQPVRHLVDGLQAAGGYAVQWNGTDDQGQALASGLYFYRLQAGTASQTRRLMLLK